MDWGKGRCKVVSHKNSTSKTVKRDLLDLGRDRLSGRDVFVIILLYFSPFIFSFGYMYYLSSEIDVLTIFKLRFFLSTNHQQIILQATIAMLTFLGIVVFYYLGKIHESDKDFILAFDSRRKQSSNIVKILNFDLTKIRASIHQWKLKVRISIIATAAIISISVASLILNQNVLGDEFMASVYNLSALGSVAAGIYMILILWRIFEAALKSLNDKLQKVYNL